MTTVFVNRKAHQIPHEVNNAITAFMQENERLKAENDKLRTELTSAAAVLNKLRANIEGTLWPNSGFANVNGSTKLYRDRHAPNCGREDV